MAHHGKNFPEDNIQLQNNYTAVIKTISHLFILRIKWNIAAHYAVKLNREHKIHEEITHKADYNLFCKALSNLPFSDAPSLGNVKKIQINPTQMYI